MSNGLEPNLYLFIWLIAGLHRNRNQEASRNFQSNCAGPMEFGELSSHVFHVVHFGALDPI